MASEKLSLYKGFALGQWRVEPLQGHIVSPDGAELHVAPKAMDVLVCLALRGGELVERSTIFSEVWGEPPWSDEALTHCVGELRHAFGDKPEHPEFFQTVPKRGYRLLTEVTVEGEQKPAAPSSDDDPPSGWLARQFGDMRKRKVFQIVIGYPVLAWLLIQIVDIIWQYMLQHLGAPAWLVPTIVVLLALGYPISIFLAWAVDLTPEGVRLTSSEKESKPLVGMAILGVGSLALTIGALFLYFNSYETPPVVVQNDTPVTSVIPAIPARVIAPMSIAVLRFLNISDNPSISYLGDGLTEELIHELTNLKTLKVAARTSVWPLSTSELSVIDIIGRLGVEKVLEGSIRSEGNKIRVTAQLIDGNGFHLWSQTYDRELEDILDLQKEIAAQVVDELDLILSDEDQVRLKTRPTLNSNAYDQYLRGRQFLRQPGTAENIQSAQEHFNAAIELDSRFSLAYAGACETYLANFRLTRATQYFEKAEIACHRALTLDGGLAEVYTALGNLYRHFGQNEKAEQEYMAALAINPLMEEATFGLGRTYQAMGQMNKAEEFLRRTVVLEPGYWGSHMGVGNFLHRQGRFAEAVPYYEEVTRLAPDYAGGYINLGSALHWLGEWDRAEAAWQTSLKLSADAWAFSNLGTLRYYKHDYVGAAKYFTNALGVTPEDHRHVGKLADSQRHTTGQEQLADRNYQQAIELVEAQLELNPEEPEDLRFLAMYRLHTGSTVAANEAIARAIELAPDSPVGPYVLALLQIESGDRASAVAQLDKAVQLGYSLKILEQDPDLAALQDLPDFQELFD